MSHAIGRRCVMRPAGSPQALGRRRQGFAARAADIQLRGGVFVPPPARLRAGCLPPSGSTAGAAFAPLRLDGARRLPPSGSTGRRVCPPPARLRAPPGTPRLPPSGSTAGSALSPTPLRGGSDTGAPYASLRYHSPPLRGSRRSRAGRLRPAARAGVGSSGPAVPPHPHSLHSRSSAPAGASSGPFPGSSGTPPSKESAKA